MRRALLALAMAGTMACGRSPQQPPNPQRGSGQILYPEQIPRREVPEDLASLAHGAVVVHRTGELSLSTSAFNAIDSDIYSSWKSPPGDPHQSLTIALGARSRIDRVALDYNAAPLTADAVRTMLFEASIDGVTFTPIAIQTLRKEPARQWLPVTPAEAAFVRATIRETFSDKSSSSVDEIMVAGKEMSSWLRPDLTGTWSLNNHTATFVQSAGQMFGRIDMKPPMLLEGGWEGRILRFFWLRENHEWGYGLMTVTADGKALNGVYWHEAPISPFQGTTWFGSRQDATANLAGDGVLEAWLSKYRRAPLYALSFNGDTLDLAQSAPALDRIARVVAAHPTTHFVLNAFEVRETDRARASARARQRVDSLLAALGTRGVDLTRVERRVAGNDPALIQNDDMQRVIHSRIELERK